MSYYIYTDNKVSVLNENQIQVSKKLEAKIYTVSFNKDLDRYELVPTDSLSLPKNLYGDIESNTTRILNTFKERKNTMGVLCSGYKGMGKSLLIKSVSIEALKYDIPTIIISELFKGEKFNTFLQSIDQECVVVFDEFDKIYEKKEDQNYLLSVFDGVYNSNKLFLVSCNDTNLLSSFLINRTGRFYYHFRYNVLKKEFIKEFIIKNNKSNHKSEDIIKEVNFLEKLTYDNIQCIMEEINRYPDMSISDILSTLNLSIFGESEEVYKIDFNINGEPKNDCLNTQTLNTNLLKERFEISFRSTNTGFSKELPSFKTLKLWDDECSLKLSMQDLYNLDSTNNRYIYKKIVDGDNYTVILSRFDPLKDFNAIKNLLGG